LRECAVYGLVDVMRFLVDEAHVDFYGNLKAIVKQALAFAQPRIMRFVLERCSVPLSRLFEEEEVLIKSDSTLNIYIGLVDGGIQIRARAGLDSMRATEHGFERELRGGQVVQTAREIVRSRRLRLSYWLEDTLLKEEEGGERCRY